VRAYSGFTLLGGALAGHRYWPRAWRTAEPQKHYGRSNYFYPESGAF
jgi:hypothetical protein